MRYTTNISMDTCEIIDSEEELVTEFGSNLIIAPSDDAVVLVDELNRQDAIINYMIKEFKLVHEYDESMIEDLYLNAYSEAGLDD